jgi:hypothetical protein
MPARLQPISAPGLICCEGPDDVAFLEWIRRSLRIESTVLSIERLDGRYGLHDYLMALALRDDAGVFRALGIVCDADREDGESAFRRVRDDLVNTKFTPPARPNQLTHGSWVGGETLAVGAFIMPDNQLPGTLEDLCLTSIATEATLTCVDELLLCVAATGIVWREQDVSKARLNVWLGSRSDPRRRLREAISANAFPIASQAFDPIKQFLTDLAAAANAPEAPRS